jgi:hypothetical protein
VYPHTHTRTHARASIGLPNTNFVLVFFYGLHLALDLQSLGYTAEIGYENFLYTNEKEVRELLIWLVGKLPKVEEEPAQEILGIVHFFFRCVFMCMHGSVCVCVCVCV